VRTRVKVSQALDNLIQHCETYTEYDPLISGAQPSNPWISEDQTFWEINSPLYVIFTQYFKCHYKIRQESKFMGYSYSSK
jgi:regulator of G-protein signaling